MGETDLNAGSLPKKVTNVINEMASITATMIPHIPMVPMSSNDLTLGVNYSGALFSGAGLRSGEWMSVRERSREPD